MEMLRHGVDMSGRRLLGVVALLVAPLAVREQARANGRYPTAQQLIEDPADARHLTLRTTYGLLTTRDRGTTWSLICEAAVGYGDTEDPVLGLFENGNLMAGIFAGLALSPDGCQWTEAQGGVADIEIVDVTLEPANRTRGLALGAMQVGAGSYVHQVWVSENSGMAWKAIGMPWGADSELVATAFDVAPSQPNRIYVSALESLGAGLVGVVRRSDDRGVTWYKFEIPNADAHSKPYLSGVSASDPDQVFVRVQTREEDRLLVSNDAGQSWRVILKGLAMMPGFALSPDGSEIVVGFGRPLIPRQKSTIDCDVLGIWKASTTDLAFTKVFSGAVNCLTWTSKGIYACTEQHNQGFTLGISSDGGKSFSGLMELTDVDSVLTCGASTAVGRECGAQWEMLCPVVGRGCADQRVAPSARGPNPDGRLSTCEPPDAGPSSGGTTAPPTGGTSIAMTQPTPKPDPPPAKEASGCGCHVLNGPAPLPCFALLLPLLSIVVVWRLLLSSRGIGFPLDPACKKNSRRARCAH